MRFGIDLGTTRTVVVLADDPDHPLVPFELPDGTPLDHFPSLLAWHEGGWRVGPEALALSSDPERPTLRSLKRWLSSPDAPANPKVTVAGQEWSVRDLLALQLTGLAQALRRPGLATPDEPLQAMVAVPASATSAQRFHTLEAFARAGFQVLGLLDEPTAAAIDYAHRHAATLTRHREQLLVYDLGGGTFDASLVDLGPGGQGVLGWRGLPTLGGHDFDQALADRVWAQLGLEPAPPAGPALLEHCRALKEALHPNTRRIHVELGASLTAAERQRFGITPDQVVAVSASDYADACGPLVEATLAELSALVPDPEHLAGVWVVGGASALPQVGRRLREVYGRRVRRALFASAATALGLARLAAHRDTPQPTDRLSRYLGVFRERASGEQIHFDLLFGPETARVPGTVAVQERRYRPVHEVGHFRFVECTRLDEAGQPAGALTLLAELHVPFDPSLRAAGDLRGRPVHRAARLLPALTERTELSPDGTFRFEVRSDDGWVASYRLGAGPAP